MKLLKILNFKLIRELSLFQPSWSETRQMTFIKASRTEKVIKEFKSQDKQKDWANELGCQQRSRVVWK